MAWTQSDIDTLKSAIAKGVMRVKQGTEEVQYRSLLEMRQTLAMMEAEVAAPRSPFTVTYARTSRGL